MANVAELLIEKENLEKMINNIIHGSIEVREQNDKRYIYVHFRDEGLSSTKYAGEYSNELYNLINYNNEIVKEYKRKLKAIRKELGAMQYESLNLSDKTKVNIDLARRYMVDLIYKQSILEGVVTTYSNTEKIVNGGKVKDMTAIDISKVVNLKHAWEFVLCEGVMSYPTNYAILCQINEIVEEGFSYTAGKVRSVPVSISGATYIPPLPFEPQIKDELNTLLSKDDSYDVAIEILLYVMKKQIFLDGNKRTAVIFANHYLISKGLGLIVIPAELVGEFQKLLVSYYESDNPLIKSFLRDKCLTKI